MSPETEALLDRIAKLEAKAKSTTNPHEAEIFAAMFDARLNYADVVNYDWDWDDDYGDYRTAEVLPPNHWTAMVMVLAKETEA